MGLEGGNTTLEQVHVEYTSQRSKDLYEETIHRVNYLTALNKFGREKVRRGDCHRVGHLLAGIKEHDDSNGIAYPLVEWEKEPVRVEEPPTHFEFAALAYGLLRLCPPCWVP